MVNLYLFDVDETLECSHLPGPVKISQLRNLRKQGHIVGLCGNFAAVTGSISDWYDFINVIGSFGLSKSEFMIQMRMYIKADRYIMIGNILPGTTIISDRTEATMGGFEFIEEKEFEEGL